MANRQKTRQYKAGQRVREAETTAARHEARRAEVIAANEQCHIVNTQLRKDNIELTNKLAAAANLNQTYEQHIAALKQEITDLTTDRDEWRDSCKDANNRFEEAERELWQLKTKDDNVNFGTEETNNETSDNAT